MKLKLLIVALLCTVAQGAWAQVSVWDGKSKEPPVAVGWPVYAIKNAAQFAWLIDRPSDYLTGKIYYRLDTDLDMGDQTWTPIGYINGDVVDFDSHLLGQGHTIRINISGATKNYQGLFARIGFEGSVENLHVTGKISCSKSRLAGGIAGENTGESTVLTRAGRDGSYGDGMTDVNGTNMTYTDGSVTVSNGSYSGTLTKADTGKEGEIKEQFYALFSAIVTNLASEDNLKIKDIPGNTWGR